MNQTRSFPSEPESVSAARRFATGVLADAPSEVRDAVELMVSELTTNCVLHADTAFDVTVDRQHENVRVEVIDRGDGTPAIRSPGPDDPTGRGLQIVNMLSETWGVEHRTAAGKTVWFVISAPTIGSNRGARTLAKSPSSR
jgi:anti-sigma regulatory factor (Ser/Thr protein kinase)